MEMSAPRNSVRWQASVASQLTKLANKDSKWNLLGVSAETAIVATRTRHGGFGRPQLNKRMVLESDSSESESEYEDLSEEEEEDELEELLDDLEEDLVDDEEEDVELGQPSHSRVIVETKTMMEAFKKHCCCPSCGNGLEIELKTVCIATTIRMQCLNPECSYLYYGDAPSAAVIDPTQEDNRERMTDYAVNVLYVAGLISIGDGCTEAGRMLGLLGLPNNTTMERRSFSIIEERISPVIKRLIDSILLENLIEEVRVTMDKSGDLDMNDFEQWKQSLEGNLVLSKRKYPKLRVSFDMAWQQRSSGNRYASPSGHALFIGGYTRKAISMVIKSKICNFCLTRERRHPGEEIPEHECLRNHEGSSGAMEPIACLEMAVALFNNRQCVVHMICLDDDASTRSLMKWSNADYMTNNNTNEPPMVMMTRGPNAGIKQVVRPDRGRLPAEIPEPMFVADPNHRKKVLTGELYALESAKKAERVTMTRMDSTRIGKNFGYMIRALPKMSEDDEAMLIAGKAVLEHHFDNHQYCGDWCRRKRKTAAERAASIRFYRCKVKDVELHKLLHEKISRFVSLDRLKEVAHGMDTQCNESFNNTASWLAPKNKVYCGSQSLQNRLSIALGINILGVVGYFKRLFKMLGIAFTADVHYYLQTKESTRTKRLAKLQLKETKKNRLKKKFDQLKADEVIARKERRSKREGTYAKGINMKDDNGDDVGPARPRKNKTNRALLQCVHCGKKGHTTTRSKQCLQYVQPATNGQQLVVAHPPPPTEDQHMAAEDDAEDLDAFDGLPLLNQAADDDVMDDLEGVAGPI
jgi:hypothetical protein